MFPLPVIALHSERDILEVNEDCRDGDVGDSKDDRPCFGIQIPCEMIEEESLSENCKVQCWKIMMNVQHTKST